MRLQVMLLALLATSPAFAAQGFIIGAPGPIAGAGLGYLAIIGGYYVIRRWRKPGE